MTYISDSRYPLEDWGAILLIPEHVSYGSRTGNTFIKVKRPRLAFARLVEHFFFTKPRSRKSKTARVSPDAVIAPSASIGDFCVVESDVEIGERTVIEHGVVIKSGVCIGSDCIIGSGCVLGIDGLGTVLDENGTVVMIRHLGRLSIGNRVEIGANSTVGKAVLDSTVIEDGVKTGPQVNIGHNSWISRDTQIAGRAHISGSVCIGESCFIGANASVNDKVKIGNFCKIGIGAVVRDDVKSNARVMGLDALPLRDMLRLRLKVKAGIDCPDSS